MSKYTEFCLKKRTKGKVCPADSLFLAQRQRGYKNEQGSISDSRGQYDKIRENTDELFLTVDGRNFRAEDAPENAAEETVLQYLAANFLEDMELYIESCAEYMRSSML